jgi:TonB family protein
VIYILSNTFNRRKNATLLWIIAISFVFHFGVLLTKVDGVPNFGLSDTEEKVIKLSFAPKKTKKKKQIVETENRGVKEKPVDTNFLSKQDNSVLKQTVARETNKFNRAGVGRKDGAKTRAQSQGKQKSIRKKKSFSLSDLRVEKAREILEIDRAPSAASAQGLKTGDKNSKGLSASNDFVEEIPLGDFTQLNTIEYKYYGFYHRIKQKLEQFWGLSIKEKVSKIYKAGRRLPAGVNHMTSLIIKINRQGKITNVSVKGSSGFKELDEAAVESFNKAGPFPNPPSGMVKNGSATIEWGFVVKS